MTCKSKRKTTIPGTLYDCREGLCRGGQGVQDDTSDLHVGVTAHEDAVSWEK